MYITKTYIYRITALTLLHLPFPWHMSHLSTLHVVPSMNQCIYITIMRKINVMYIIDVYI